jgi:nuclear pore complex protein Nup98-Nup96
MTDDELSRVSGFAVYRPDFGKIVWSGETDVRGLDLDKIVSIEASAVCVYDEESDPSIEKPDQGYGLNKPAIIYLENVFPKKIQTEADLKKFEEKLVKTCEKGGSKFIDYDSSTGRWTFEVEHFSKYGLLDSDDEEDAAAASTSTNTAAAAVVAATGAGVTSAAAAIAKNIPAGSGSGSPALPTTLGNEVSYSSC